MEIIVHESCMCMPTLCHECDCSRMFCLRCSCRRSTTGTHHWQTQGSKIVSEFCLHCIVLVVGLLFVLCWRVGVHVGIPALCHRVVIVVAMGGWCCY